MGNRARKKWLKDFLESPDHTPETEALLRHLERYLPGGPGGVRYSQGARDLKRVTYRRGR